MARIYSYRQRRYISVPYWLAQKVKRKRSYNKRRRYAVRSARYARIGASRRSFRARGRR